MLALLGLARKAGQLVSGDMACREALQRRHVHLLILANDAANRTKRFYIEEAKRAGIPLMETAISKAALGHAIGSPDRAVIVVCHPGFAKGLLAAIDKPGDYVRGDVNAKNTRF